MSDTPSVEPRLHGKHLIAGTWSGGDKTFTSAPAHGPARQFAVGTPEDVDAACKAAEEAFLTFGWTSREERAVLLERIADEIEARAAEITVIGTQESGLPVARLEGERGRTTGQLRLFAKTIRAGDYLDRRHDEALPDRKPAPRPDMKMIQRPIGPVAVFGASNFPLAFSTAGGDTAAALAAGCPVVVKGHSAHPGTGEIVAQAIDAALRALNMPAGIFSLIQGGNRAVGEALVQHPLIRAVGFTGSLGGGRALFNLCAARPEPIPFFGELGSVNPVFLLPGALAERGASIAEGWAGSVTMGAGQFCTNPGIVVAIEGPATEAFAPAAQAALEKVQAQTMLTEGIASAFHSGRDRIEAAEGVSTLLNLGGDARSGAPALYSVSAEAWLANPDLGEEVFGPLGMIVTCRDEAEMLAVARSLHGQLTCTLHMGEGDTALGQKLVPILERKAGRILGDGFPTGVEVADAMVHGGPYPASTNFGATSVGTLSIRRFLRPVSYQSLPEALLPADLR